MKADIRVTSRIELSFQNKYSAALAPIADIVVISLKRSASDPKRTVE